MAVYKPRFSLSAMSERGGIAARQRLTRDERRERILEAASQVFADRGYEGASIEEIAEAAGITRPVIYDHFDSKRDLHISLLELHVEQLLDFMGERVASEESSEGRLEAGFERVLRVRRDPSRTRGGSCSATRRRPTRRSSRRTSG